MVDHICITCDRIAELKHVVFRHICNVSNSFCCGTRANFHDNMNIYSGLDNSLHPTKESHMLDCSRLARLKSDLSYMCCLSQKLLPSCVTDLYFTYVCNLSCILYIAGNDHDPISICSTYNNSVVEAWYKPTVVSHMLD